MTVRLPFSILILTAATLSGSCVVCQGPGCTDWAATNSGIAAYATIGAVVVAFGVSWYSMRQVRKQIALQNEIEGRRVQEKYLSSALYVTHDCYKATQTFVSAWHHPTTEHGKSEGRISAAQKILRTSYNEAWRKFDREVDASFKIFSALGGSGTALGEKLKVLHDKSANLFDKVMENPNVVATEDQLDVLAVAVEARKAADAASEALAQRLANLHG